MLVYLCVCMQLLMVGDAAESGRGTVSGRVMDTSGGCCKARRSNSIRGTDSVSDAQRRVQRLRALRREATRLRILRGMEPHSATVEVSGRNGGEQM